MKRSRNDSVAPSQHDSARWQQILALFEEMLESSSPLGVLQGEKDELVRVEAENLWRHHLEADQEQFLGQSAPIVVPPMFHLGRLLAGRFEVEGMLGVGGMGEVYLASDRKLNEKVALKTIGRALVTSERVRRHFLAEVQNARRVTHPNVCRIYDVFDDGEITFFAMEFVPGDSLATLLSRTGAITQAKPLLLQMASGLAAAHENGIVHGDFKPANVMITPGDPPRAVITDFGLARALAGGSVSAGLERISSIFGGTIEYMAPELLVGAAPSVRSDIYAFGKVAEQLLPGHSLWSNCTNADIERRPVSFQPIIRGLQPNYTRRYMLGAVAGVVATGAATYALKPNGGSPSIESGARLLVNGFAGADAASARLFRSIFLTALVQSPRIRAIADQDVLPALRRLAPRASLPAAGEMLTRLMDVQRAAYWIDGTLTQIGSRYSMTLSLLRRTDSRLILELGLRDLPALAALAQSAAEQFRRAVGESASSIQGNPASVTSYTSAVPEALQKYYEAMDHYAVADMDAAVPLLQEAIRLDEKFAQAYNILAMCVNTDRRVGESFQLLQRAFDLSRNLPVRERTWIDSNYYMLGEDPERMVEAARRNVSYFPDESRFLRILAYVLCRTGSAPESLPYIRRSAELAPQNDMSRVELIVNLCEAGQFAEGLAEFQKARAEGNVSANLERGAGLAYLGLGDYERALASFERLPDQPKRMTEGAKILRGDLSSAIAGLQQYLASSLSRQIAIDEHQAREFLAGTLFLMDKPELARENVQGMALIEPLPPHVRQLECSAFWAGWTQEHSALKQSVERLDALARKWPNSQSRASLTHAQGIQSLATGDTAAAEKRFLESLGYAPSVWTLFDLGALFGRTSRPQLAEEYWARFDERKGTILKLWFPGLLVLSWLNRAGAASQNGNRALTKQYSKMILDHWALRNPNLGIVQAARTLFRTVEQ